MKMKFKKGDIIKHKDDLPGNNGYVFKIHDIMWSTGTNDPQPEKYWIGHVDGRTFHKTYPIKNIDNFYILASKEELSFIGLLFK